MRGRDRQQAQGIYVGYTLHVPPEEFPALRTRLPTLWSRSYSAGSVGHVGDATVERYIASQEGK
ncbi:MAG: transposase [Singulisphaera sp.]|nr:transposase [Singulisphaera sp.]